MTKLIIVLLMIVSTYATATPAVLVYNISNHRVIIQEGDHSQRPIASLTKLMTAMVVLDSNQSLTEKINISQKTGTLLPQQYRRIELLHAMLVHSDNAAASALADSYPGGRYGFVTAMNIKARYMGLINTVFADPSGLSVFNVSTPYDVGIMLTVANQYEMIRSISTQLKIKLASNNRSGRYLNTNYDTLLKFKNIVVSKTGFTNLAGFCMAVVVDKHNQQFAVVILGEKNKRQRAITVNRIIQQLS